MHARTPRPLLLGCACDERLRSRKPARRLVRVPGRLSSLGERIPTPVRGVLWMFAAGFSFAAMSALIRPASAELHSFQVVFFRNLLGLLIFAPWLFRRIEWRVWRSPNRRLHVLRACILLGAMSCWFAAIPHIALTDAVALNFTAPLFVTAIAALFLGEIVRLRRWVAIVLGFAGVLIVIRPGFEALHPAQLLVLLDALLWAVAIIMIRVLSRTESPQIIVAYMFILVLPLSAVPAAFVWTWPSLEVWPAIFGLAVASTSGHYCSTRAFAVAEASVVMPFDYLRLLWFALAGYLFFGEVPDRWTLAGAAVIAGSSLYLLHREHRLARHDRARLAREASRQDPAPNGSTPAGSTLEPARTLRHRTEG